MTETITQTQAQDILKRDNGRQFFTVCFIKRTNGETRIMNCRKGVRKGTTGEGLKFNPVDKGLVEVFDVAKNQYRFISLDNIIRINIRGQRYIVKS